VSSAAELVRPPPHRGPLIAAGAVLVTVAMALVELRLGGHLGAGVHLLVLALAAAPILGLGLQAPNEDGRPPGYQSVLLVCGLLLLAAALLRLADALGADLSGRVGDGTLAWTGAATAGAAGWAAATRRSAVCALIAAVAGGTAVLALVDWIVQPGSFALTRWVLLAVAGVLIGLSLVLRASRPRHAELLVDAAGLAVLAIAVRGLAGEAVAAVIPFGGPPEQPLPDVFELVVLAAGCGLVAYGAVDRLPGPAWLGVANLAAFVLVTTPGGATLRWWPVVLLALGVGAMGAGLRPRRPLPPEPTAYPAGDQPLAARTDGDDGSGSLRAAR
jgi:hypothetical protein